MRAILFAMLIALGIGLVGTSGLSAAPISGPAIGDAATATDVGTNVQHWRWGSGGHYRWGSRGGHWRFGSRGPVCRTICRHRPYTSARVCTRVC
jgi:hypothetical protein